MENVYGDTRHVTPELAERYYELVLREGNRTALFNRMIQYKHGVNAEQIRYIRQPTLIL